MSITTSTEVGKQLHLEARHRNQTELPSGPLDDGPHADRPSRRFSCRTTGSLLSLLAHRDMSKHLFILTFLVSVGAASCCLMPPAPKQMYAGSPRPDTTCARNSLGPCMHAGTSMAGSIDEHGSGTAVIVRMGQFPWNGSAPYCIGVSNCVRSNCQTRAEGKR